MLAAFVKSIPNPKIIFSIDEHSENIAFFRIQLSPITALFKLPHCEKHHPPISQPLPKTTDFTYEFSKALEPIIVPSGIVILSESRKAHLKLPPLICFNVFGNLIASMSLYIVSLLP